MKKIKTLFLLEDDIITSRMIKTYFEERGFIVHQSFDIGSGFFKMLSNRFDVGIIDIDLPSGSSLELYNKMERVLQCPIIVCTSSDSEWHEILCLELGVEDYVNKSRGLEVLYKRVMRALCKSSGDLEISNPHVIEIGGAELNSQTHELEYNQVLVRLTKQESKVLHYLGINFDQVVSKDELYYVIQGVSYDGASRSLDLLVSRIRKKIASENVPINIVTIHGHGYLVQSVPNPM